MAVTIISNNCSGARIQQDMKMQYCSPTIVLQILPEQYPKFCRNIKYYLKECELVEYKDFSEDHRKKMEALIDRKVYFPCGLLDDVVVMFQHYKTFEEAKEKWDRRVKRVDFKHMGFLFVLEKPYINEAIEFGNSGLKNAVLFTNGFDVDVPIEHHRYDLKEGQEYLGRSPINGLRNFESGFDRKGWIKKIEE